MKREDVSKIIPGITPEQLDGIMNLHGADITAKANEITTLEAEKATLTEQLNTANGKLEGYDPEWKAKAEQAKADAASQVAALEKGYALERKASGLKFSSESARKAFLTDAKAQNFAMKDGEILGFDDYVKTFKAADPSAILPDGSMVQFSASAPGGSRQPANAHEAANAASGPAGYGGPARCDAHGLGAAQSCDPHERRPLQSPVRFPDRRFGCCGIRRLHALLHL